MTEKEVRNILKSFQVDPEYPASEAVNQSDLVKPSKPKPDDKPTESDSTTPTDDDRQNRERELNVHAHKPKYSTYRRRKVMKLLWRNSASTRLLITGSIRTANTNTRTAAKVFIAYGGMASNTREIHGNIFDIFPEAVCCPTSNGRSSQYRK